MNTAFVPPATQTPCCYTSAMEADATFCGECGKALMRCMAVEECGGLLDDHGLCTVCVSPSVQIDAGATIAAKVGGAVAVPLSISNRSVVGRPLFVTGIWSREGGGDWRPQNMGWERLEAGETRPVSVTANELERVGAHNIEILFALASRWRWREERFAFSTSLRLSVDETKADSNTVVNIGGDSAGHGNVVYISGQGDQDGPTARSADAIDLALVRADKEERRLGLRGLNETQWVSKTASFEWKGFAENDAPTSGPISTPDGLLAFGRSRTRTAEGLGDVRLLAHSPDGSVDEQTSRMISRRHFELYLECDRLMLRVNSDSGVRISSNAYGPGKTVALNDGDTISPLVNAPERLALAVKYRTELGVVRVIELARLPVSS